MQLLILHLSDIHIKNEREPIFQKVDKLISAILPICSDTSISGILLIVSGVLAFSGKAEEYKVCADLLSRIRDALQEATKKSISFFVVPGNHDCHFQQDDVRDLILGHLKSPSSIKPQYLGSCLEPQTNFFSFYEEMNGHVFQNRLHWIEEQIFEEKKVAIRCINSAWMSQLDESPGTLAFPTNELKSISSDW